MTIFDKEIGKSIHLDNETEDDASGELSETGIAKNFSDDEYIQQLSQLSRLDYERVREDAAERLGIKRVSELDKIVKEARNEIDQTEQVDELEAGIEPWHEPVDGCALADEIKGVFNTYSILPEGADVAMTLWSLGTYVFNEFRIFPKLCISSPEKRCGKTTTLEVLGSLVHKNLIAANMTPATIFRSIDLWKPTLLIDEGDTFLRGNDELRGIINSGHTRSSASVLRTEGDSSNRRPVRYSTWSPMAIAMIKTPPDTIKDRSILITLRRKLPHEVVSRLPIELSRELHHIRRKCQRWAQDESVLLRHSDTEVPSISNDRAADNWLPMFVIANQLGGQWPTLVKSSMQDIEDAKLADDDDGIGPMILKDIQEIMMTKNLDKVFSDDLVRYLVEMEERPWSEWKRGYPMTKNSLANLLKPFGITSISIRQGHDVKRGYDRSHFIDVFRRYISPIVDEGVTTLQTMLDKASGVAFEDNVALQDMRCATSKPIQDVACSTVAPQKYIYGCEGRMADGDSDINLKW